MFICEVTGTEINFELKFSKYSKTLRGLILMEADFYKIKKKNTKKTIVCGDQFSGIF